MGPILENPDANPTSLYESDYHAWLAEQARLLKAGRLSDLDTPNLIEEVEDKRRTEEAELQSAIQNTLLYLAKLAYCRSSDLTNGWQVSVVKQRVEIEKRLRRSPGLKSRIEDLYQEAWSDARKVTIAEMSAHHEHPAVPEACPFSLRDVRDEGYWPAALPPKQ